MPANDDGPCNKVPDKLLEAKLTDIRSIIFLPKYLYRSNQLFLLIQLFLYVEGREMQIRVPRRTRKKKVLLKVYDWKTRC